MGSLAPVMPFKTAYVGTLEIPTPPSLDLLKKETVSQRFSCRAPSVRFQDHTGSMHTGQIFFLSFLFAFASQRQQVLPHESFLIHTMRAECTLRLRAESALVLY
jgi:hypothetical protein